MRVLVKTTDPATLSFAQALLGDAEIHAVIMDGHMSVLEPGIMIPKRLMVLDDDWEDAVAVLKSAGLGGEVEA